MLGPFFSPTALFSVQTLGYSPRNGIDISNSPSSSEAAAAAQIPEGRSQRSPPNRPHNPLVPADLTEAKRISVTNRLDFWYLFLTIYGRLSHNPSTGLHHCIDQDDFK